MASFLVRNPYSYCFRSKVPPDLRYHLSKTELLYSLRIGSLSQAKYKVRILAGMVQRLFKGNRKLRTMKLTGEKIQEIASGYLKRIVDHFNNPEAPPNADTDSFVTTFGPKKMIEAMDADKWQIAVGIETGNYR